MKPSFALNLNPDAIALLHRTGRGWIVVGEVPLDAPDLGEAMAYLRATALGLEPRGLTTKLIIPPSQILYRKIEAPGPSVAKRREQIAAALDGATPYPVEELVFAWSGTGAMVQVAVVARETLQEAEQFALEHRFNPVSFVAIPEPLNFAGEPFFGQTDAAPVLLAGDTFERDQEPVRIVGRASLPPADAPMADAAPPEPYAAPAPVGEAEPEAAPAAVEDAAAAEAPVEDAAPAGPEEARDATTEAAPVGPEPVDAPPEAAPAAEAVMPDAALAQPEDVVPAVPEDETVKPAPVSELRAPSMSGQMDEADEAPFVEAIDDDDVVIAPASVSELREPGSFGLTDRPRVSVTSPVIPEDDIPPPPPAPSPQGQDASPGPAFFSRRGTAEARPLSAPLVETPAPPAGARLTLTAMPEAVKTALAAKRGKPKPAAPGGIAGREPPPLKAQRPKTKPQAPQLPERVDHSRFLPDSPVEATTGLTPPDAPRMARPAPAVPPVTTPPDVPRPASEAEAMTVFGARKGKPQGAPLKVGIILTLVLLLLIGAVVVWSSMQPSRTAPPGAAQVQGAAQTPDAGPAASPAQTQQASASVAGDAATASATQASVGDAGTGGQQPNATTAPASSGATAPAAVVTATPSAVPDTVATASDGAPTAVLQATAMTKPPAPAPSAGEITLASVDPSLPSAPQSVLTARGPDGHDGTPRVTPPPQPQPASPAAAAPAPAADTAPAALAALQAPAPAPAATPTAKTAAVTPLPRPLAGPVLPSVRPKARPTTGIFAKPAAAASQTATADAGGPTLGAPPSDLVSPLALAASPRPKGLPRQLLAMRTAASRASDETLNKSVNAAVASALAVNTQTRQSPEAQPEPETPTKMPPLPANPSVAKEATIVGAINLNRINLLGVFGTAENRTALVRLSGGRVKTVHVGDVLDGGRVAAIGEDMLYYVKNGRNVQLTLPKG
ncbi:MAG: hypothetical protein KGN33_01940 [Paracoccaceae bacterium]|nr:hypothetical protein [Paracoccaceae bacterium]